MIFMEEINMKKILALLLRLPLLKLPLLKLLLLV